MDGVEQVHAARRHAPALGRRDRRQRARSGTRRSPSSIPTQRVAWTATSGKDNAGVVTFQPLGDDRTRGHGANGWEPEGVIEKIGGALGRTIAGSRRDLERFKELIEARGAETGAWRGEVENPSD